MPITKTMAYSVSGAIFPTMESAKVAAIDALLNGTAVNVEGKVTQIILEHADELIAILTCKPEENKPVRKPRSDKGTKRKKDEAINRVLQDGKQ